MESCDIISLSENITNYCDNTLPIDSDCESMCIQTLLTSLSSCYDIWLNTGLYNRLVEILLPCMDSSYTIISSK